MCSTRVVSSSLASPCALPTPSLTPVLINNFLQGAVPDTFPEHGEIYNIFCVRQLTRDEPDNSCTAFHVIFYLALRF